MPKTALPLLFLALALPAFAQTTTTITESPCVRVVATCHFNTADGGQAWLNHPYFLDILNASGGIVASCSNFTSYAYAVEGPLPTASHQVDVPWTLHAQCGNIVLDVLGHAHWNPYKYAGVYYFADSGTLTY